MLRQIFLLHSFILLSNILFAGAWNREKGKGYGQVSFTYLRYQNLLNGNGDPIGLKRPVYDMTTHFYMEYGISNRFNLVLNLPYKNVGTQALISDVENDPYTEDTLVSGDLQGLSNLSAGLRIAILQKKWVVSLQMLYSTRASDYDQPTGLRTGYDAEIFTPSLNAGLGLERRYYQFEAGMQFKSDGYAQNCIGSFEAGLQFKNQKTWIMLRIDWRMPVNTGHHNDGNTIQTGLYRDNASYISPGFKLNQKLYKGISLNLAIYGAIYSKYEGANATFNLGLAYQW